MQSKNNTERCPFCRKQISGGTPEDLLAHMELAHHKATARWQKIIQAIISTDRNYEQSIKLEGIERAEWQLLEKPQPRITAGYNPKEQTYELRFSDIRLVDFDALHRRGWLYLDAGKELRGMVKVRR